MNKSFIKDNSLTEISGQIIGGMDLNIKTTDEIIFESIKSGHIRKAINLLTKRIKSCDQRLTGDYRRVSNGVDTRLHNYLIRSYCYYKLGSTDGYSQAIEDVFSAKELDDTRYQPYLLGALILSDMKQWNRSLEMLEKSIEMNPNLFQTFVQKLVYLKYKLLVDLGFDEEVSFRCALKYRTLDDCIDNIDVDTETTDSLILELIANHKTEYLTTDSAQNNVFDHKTQKPFGQRIAECVDRLSSPIDDFFSSGDQNPIKLFDKRKIRPNNELLNISLESKATTDENNSPNDGSAQFMATKFNGISISEPKVKHKSNSIQDWIESNFRSDSVSKMCSFVDKPESPPVDPTLCSTARHRNDSLSMVSDVNSIYLDDKLSIGSDNRHLATNLQKLRGVYVGNIKKKCNEKVLKDLFRKYGTIQDFYQPFGQNYAFIHFKSHESALQLLTEWKGQRLDVCTDNKKLMVRFTPSQDQMSKYNSMSLEEYKNRCNREHECHLWRAGKRCPDKDDCPFKHIPINRAVDTLPDKRKANWKCN